MNTEQKKVLVYGLYGLSILLLLVFWRLGTQYDYTTSLLIWKISDTDAPSSWGLLPKGVYGLRLRMGGLGVLCGLILPAVLTGAAVFISKSEKQ